MLIAAARPPSSRPSAASCAPRPTPGRGSEAARVLEHNFHGTLPSHPRGQSGFLPATPRHPRGVIITREKRRSRRLNEFKFLILREMGHRVKREKGALSPRAGGAAPRSGDAQGGEGRVGRGEAREALQGDLLRPGRRREAEEGQRAGPLCLPQGLPEEPSELLPPFRE